MINDSVTHALGDDFHEVLNDEINKQMVEEIKGLNLLLESIWIELTETR